MISSYMALVGQIYIKTHVYIDFFFNYTKKGVEIGLRYLFRPAVEFKVLTTENDERNNIKPTDVKDELSDHSQNRHDS